jgi:hypothetical protein
MHYSFIAALFDFCVRVFARLYFYPCRLCSMASAAEHDRVQVAVRVRPHLSHESKASQLQWQLTSQEVKLSNNSGTGDGEQIILSQHNFGEPLYAYKLSYSTNYTFFIGTEHVFDEASLNLHVFDQTVKPIVDSVLEGFNGNRHRPFAAVSQLKLPSDYAGTAFAYGQTASGKTHTMTGENNFF